MIVTPQFWKNYKIGPDEKWVGGWVVGWMGWWVGVFGGGSSDHRRAKDEKPALNAYSLLLFNL